MFFFKAELTLILHGLGLSCVRRECNDDRCPLENSLNMHSVWTAWFQFWGKQHLHIDVLFLRNIVNVQHRIKWGHLDRQKKSIKMQQNFVIAFCVPSRAVRYRVQYSRWIAFDYERDIA